MASLFRPFRTFALAQQYVRNHRISGRDAGIANQVAFDPELTSRDPDAAVRSAAEILVRSAGHAAHRSAATGKKFYQ